jgi:hypothetical protein
LCNEGYTGDHCEIKQCKNNCFYNEKDIKLSLGVCSNGICICRPGFEGDDCSTKTKHQDYVKCSLDCVNECITDCSPVPNFNSVKPVGVVLDPLAPPALILSRKCLIIYFIIIANPAGVECFVNCGKRCDAKCGKR